MDNKNSWVPYKGLSIHSGLFDKGIVLVKPGTVQRSEEKKFSISNTSFNLGDGTFSFLPENPEENITYLSKRHYKEVMRLIGLLTEFSSSSESKALSIRKYLPESMLINSKHRSAFFVPFVLENNNVHASWYLYPWLSQNSTNYKFTGFNNFVTACCMFGANLKAISTLGKEWPFVKHAIAFEKEEQIASILFNSDENAPYEEIQMKELEEKVIYFMKKFTKLDEKKPQLICHLPTYDYMLVGIDLYMDGRITLDALSQFFEFIVEKKPKLLKKMAELSARYGVDIKVISPFDNLFGALAETVNAKGSVLDAVFLILGLDKIERQPQTDTDKLKGEKLSVIKLCFDKLRHNSFDPAQAGLWDSFLAAETLLNEKVKFVEAEIESLRQKISNLSPSVESNVAEIKKLTAQLNKKYNEEFVGLEKNLSLFKFESIEDIFKMANVIPIAIASQKNPSYTTCSFLAVSEKQIQVTYSQYSKIIQLDKNATVKPVFNITTLDPVIACYPGSKGLIFYMNSCLQDLCKFLDKQNILAHASENLAAFAQGKPRKVSADNVVFKKTYLRVESLFGDSDSENSSDSSLSASETEAETLLRSLTPPRIKFISPMSNDRVINGSVGAEAIPSDAKDRSSSSRTENLSQFKNLQSSSAEFFASSLEYSDKSANVSEPFNDKATVTNRHGENTKSEQKAKPAGVISTSNSKQKQKFFLFAPIARQRKDQEYLVNTNDGIVLTTGEVVSQEDLQTVQMVLDKLMRARCSAAESKPFADKLANTDLVAGEQKISLGVKPVTT